MKRFTTITLAAAVLMLSACSTSTAGTSTAPTSAGADSTSSGAPSGQGQSTSRNTTQTVGMVTEVFGNMITIQVGEMVGGGGMGSPSGGAVGSGMMGGTSGAAVEGGGRATSGSAMGSLSEEELAEMMAERQAQGGTAQSGGQMPEGMTPPTGTGDRTSGGDRTAGGTMQGGGMIMSGGDMSELITLTDETKEYTIPVGTAVVNMGQEFTFSQITEEMYVSITEDEDGTVLTVNVLTA